MKVKPFQIPSLSTQLNGSVDAVVIYGTDDGEMQHAVAQIKRQLHITTDNLTVFTKDQLKQIPFLATDEANTTSFMQTRRFLLIPDDVSFSANALVHFIQNKKTDALLIIQGGNLSKTNPLRVEAEKNPRTLAIVCYQPSLQDIQRIVVEYLTQHHKKIAPKVLSELCKKTSFNQQLIFQELDKLLLYVGSQTEITEQDLHHCITDNTEFSLDTFCINLADGKAQDVMDSLHIFLISEESETTLFWAVRGYFERLLNIVTDTSGSPDQIVQKNLKPFQFYLKDPLLRQSRYWSAKNILTLLNRLTKLEALTRTTGYPKTSIIEQAFLSLVSFAQKLTRLR